MDFKNLSLIELSALISSGQSNPKEIYMYFRERTQKYNATLNAFNTLPPEDYPLQEGDISLTHLPIAIKDAFCVNGVRTTSSSKMLENFVPPYESTVTERIKKAGFLAFGKTNMDEFALGSTGENSAFGATKNPWDPTRIP